MTTNNTCTGANTTKAMDEVKELSHAAHCTDLYLRNTSEIYERYTLKAIAAVVEAKRENENGNARLEDETAWNNLAFWISWQPVVKNALNAAARLVKKYDHITPTAKDIADVKADYVAYIVEGAQYEVNNA